MTDTVLNPAQVGVSMPELPKRKPVVDLGTRMAHASMALAFLISYVTSESEYWRLVHVYSGYSLAAVLAYALPLKLNIVLAILMAVFACLMVEQLKALKERPA